MKLGDVLIFFGTLFVGLSIFLAIRGQACLPAFFALFGVALFIVGWALGEV